MMKEDTMGAKQQGADATQDRWLTLPRTLCFVFRGDDVLLMKRASYKRVFPNQYNGLGGHIERDEDPHTGAIREIKEESGLDVYDVRFRGAYNIDAGASTGIVLFIFTAWSKSSVVENRSNEGTLHWIKREEAFHLDLVEDLPYILSRIFSMEDATPPFFVHVSYDQSDKIQMQFSENQ